MALLLAAFIAVLTLIQYGSGQSTCEMAFLGTGVAPTSDTLTSSAIKSATVTCTGAPVDFNGVAAMSAFGAAFKGAISAKQVLWQLKHRSDIL